MKFAVTMHRFLGLPPPVKKVKTKEDISLANKKYDAEKRHRTFQTSWTSEFQWVLYDNKNEKMYCQTCRSVYGPLALKKKQPGNVPDRYTKYAAGPLVTGCSNLRKSVLTGHKESDGHKEAEVILASRKAKPGETIAEKSLQKINQEAFDRLVNLFRNAHAIAYHSRPFKDFTWMCNLDEKKGVNVGCTYRNDKQCKVFVDAIAAVERKDLETDLKRARFVSLMSDGSVDVATIENEVVYARYAVAGEVKCVFLSMQAVPRANAPGIYKALMDSISMFETISLTEFQEMLVGFGCDGASVNTGSVSGVITLLQQRISEEIVLLRCMAHRIELAYKDCIKNVTLYTKLYTLLTELFNFYHKSSLQTENLKETFLALDLPTALPHRVGGTRFVAHVLGALKQVWNGYPAYVQHLGQVRVHGNYSVQNITV